MLQKDIWWAFLLLAACSYLIGSINFSVFISKRKGKDIRDIGSGNPGTMNMSRTFGLKTGIFVFLLDVLKGAVPTFVGFLLFKDKNFFASDFLISDMTKYMCGFFAVLGHIYPLYFKFKGGKGIATTIGVFLVGEPIVGAIFVFVALAFILLTAMGSMGSLIAITPPAIAAQVHLYNRYLADGKAEVIFPIIITDVFIIGICILSWAAHRKNIMRLLSGEEHETSWSEMIRNAKLKRRQKKHLDKSLDNKDDD